MKPVSRNFPRERELTNVVQDNDRDTDKNTSTTQQPQKAAPTTKPPASGSSDTFEFWQEMCRLTETFGF